MLCVVSGQTVVHSESSKPSMTTLPRNWLSDIGWPNWFTSLMSGAGCRPSELPRSRFGFISAALAAGLACMPPDDMPVDEPELALALAPHPASAVSTLSMTAAASAPRGRNVFIAKPAYCYLLRVIVEVSIPAGRGREPRAGRGHWVRLRR